MHKNIKIPALLAGFTVTLLLQQARAQESTFELDPAKTQIEFVLPTTLHTVHGTFHVKGGTIHFNLSTGAASGRVLVDATSGESGSEGRDRRMHKEILESDKYPDITFTPVRVTGQLAAQGDSTLQIEGTFRLHGSDHPINVAIPVHISGEVVTANYHFAVPYVQWGLKNPSKFVLRVNDTVDVNVVAEGHLTQAVAAR